MILTVCLNPAVDITYRLDSPLEPGSTHRVGSVHERAGGKGINVARVLHQLGESVTVLAPVGGGTGTAIRSDLVAGGIPTELVDVAGTSRRTLAVVEESRATMLAEPGPTLAAGDWAALLAAFERLLPAATLVVLSGSLPPGLPTDGYRVLTERADAHSLRVVLDADAEPFLSALPARPYLVKPNLAELAGVLGAEPAVGELESVEQVVAGGRRLITMGARNVVVSRGEDGLVAITEDGCWQVRTDAVVAGNPTGAGDALVAALALGTVRGDPWLGRLRDGAATGAAAVAAPLAGEIDPAARAAAVASVRVAQSGADA
jgi:tagatose 6-phosphate kinase